MAEMANKTPSWFNKLLKNQDVSNEVLLHFKKQYLTSIGREKENEGS
jgi:hypothetical protein